MAVALSDRIARASSSLTSKPLPPPCVPSARQRGQVFRASVQLVITTSQSRKRHVARSPLCSEGGPVGAEEQLVGVGVMHEVVVRQWGFRDQV